MKNFVLIDFLIEKIKKLFYIIENHNHDDVYVKKEELEIDEFIKQTPNRLTIDYKIKNGNNAVVAGPFEIKGGTTLEIPKDSVLSII